MERCGTTGSGWTSPTGTTAWSTCWSSRPKASTSSRCGCCCGKTGWSRRSRPNSTRRACWEVLTDPRLCQQYFTAEERQLFQRHILWTRVLSRPPDGAARRAAGQPARVRAHEPRSARAQAEPLVRRRRHRDRPGGHARRVGDRAAGGAGRSGRPLGRAAARHDPGAGVPRGRRPTARCTSSRSTR